MPFMTNLKPALIRFGLGPYLEEVPGWETRGSSAFAPACSIGHHTAGPLSGDRPSLNICVNGRTDLPGPLCNDFLSRTKVVLVAAGRANHAGTGGYRGLAGNSAAFGNEAESTGVLRRDGSPDWSEFQRWAFPRVHAAHLWLLGRGPEWYIGHRDWTSRKIDPTAIDTLDMRAQIADVMNNPEDDMPLTDADIDRIWQRAIVSRDGTAPAQNVLREIQQKVYDIGGLQIPDPDKAAREKNPNATTKLADFVRVTAQLVARQTGAVDVLTQLVAQQNGLTVDDVRAAVREEMAKGVDVNVTVAAQQD